MKRNPEEILKETSDFRLLALFLRGFIRKNIVKTLSFKEI